MLRYRKPRVGELERQLRMRSGRTERIQRLQSNCQGLHEHGVCSVGVFEARTQAAADPEHLTSVLLLGTSV